MIFGPRFSFIFGKKHRHNAFVVHVEGGVLRLGWLRMATWNYSTFEKACVGQGKTVSVQIFAEKKQTIQKTMLFSSKKIQCTTREKWHKNQRKNEMRKKKFKEFLQLVEKRVMKVSWDSNNEKIAAQDSVSSLEEHVVEVSSLGFGFGCVFHYFSGLNQEAFCDVAPACLFLPQFLLEIWTRTRKTLVVAWESVAKVGANDHTWQWNWKVDTAYRWLDAIWLIVHVWLKVRYLTGIDDGGFHLPVPLLFVLMDGKGAGLNIYNSDECLFSLKAINYHLYVVLQGVSTNATKVVQTISFLFRLLTPKWSFREAFAVLPMHSWESWGIESKGEHTFKIASWTNYLFQVTLRNHICSESVWGAKRKKSRKWWDLNLSI